MGSITKDDLKEMLAKSNKNTEAAIEKAVATIRSDLTAISSRCDKLETRVTTLESAVKKLSSQLKTAETETKTLKEKIACLESNSIENDERHTRLNRININGVPFVENENLQLIFNEISSKVGFEIPPTTRIVRFGGQDPMKRPISVTFSDELRKQEFLSSYFKVAKNLTVRALTGFTGPDSRIFMQHDLTSQQYRINKAALALKRENKIYFMRILHGKVAIKIKKEDKLTTFHNFGDFEAFAKSE